MIFHLRTKLLGFFFQKIPIFNDYSMKKHLYSIKHLPKSISFYIFRRRKHKETKTKKKEIKKRTDKNGGCIQKQFASKFNAKLLLILNLKFFFNETCL